MDINNLLSKNLELAFRQLKSLAVKVTLIKRQQLDYDFNIDNPVEATTNILTSAIVVGKQKKNRDTNTITQSILLKVADIQSINLYDTISINNLEWKLNLPININGPVISLDISREE